MSEPGIEDSLTITHPLRERDTVELTSLSTYQVSKGSGDFNNTGDQVGEGTKEGHTDFASLPLYLMAVDITIFLLMKDLRVLSRVPVQGSRDAVDPIMAASIRQHHRREWIS
jgi:hypothetical protein